MTIRPGDPWGEPGPLGANAPVFATDRAARTHLQDRFEQFGLAGLGELGLVAGDLHRTLGSPQHTAEVLRAGHGVRYPVDLGVVTLADREFVFLSHLVAHEGRRLRWWSGRTVVAMNAGFVGPMDLGPRSHPNDGRLDVTDGALPRGERLQGRQRARSGTHVPHPDLETRSVRRVDIVARPTDSSPAEPLHVWLDGEHVGAAIELTVRCAPDALVVVA